MGDPFGRGSTLGPRHYERVPVDPERRTPREDVSATLRRMAEVLDAMSPEEIAALIAEDSVDEAAE